MKTVTINSQEELQNHLVDGDLIVDGNLIITCGINVPQSIKIKGWIETGGSIKAGGYIIAGYSIKARRSIITGGSIKAGDSIEAGDWIKARGWIEAEHLIKAGNWIEATYIHSMMYELNCKHIKTTILPYWRNYYAGIFPQYAYIIDDKSKCWDDIIEDLMPHKDEIIAYPWHPIMKAQVRMFFRDVESVKF